MANRKQDTAYLAGLIDGEGCFNAPKSETSPRLVIGMTNRPILEWCQKRWRGQIYTVTPRKFHRKQQWTWYLTDSHDLCSLIEEVAPLLKIKRRQAWAIWKLATVKGWAKDNIPGSKGHSSSIKKFYAGLAASVSRYNQSGVLINATASG